MKEEPACLSVQGRKRTAATASFGAAPNPLPTLDSLRTEAVEGCPRQGSQRALAC